MCEIPPAHIWVNLDCCRKASSGYSKLLKAAGRGKLMASHRTSLVVAMSSLRCHSAAGSPAWNLLACMRVGWSGTPPQKAHSNPKCGLFPAKEPKLTLLCIGLCTNLIAFMHLRRPLCFVLKMLCKTTENELRALRVPLSEVE